MYKILIAEDETIERKVLCRILARELRDCCQLYEARNGREAVSLALQEHPQIAILDIQMPGITGLEVARRIREEKIPCAVLFLTAFDNFSYAKEAISVRAVDYLLKPYDEKELLLSVETAMELYDGYFTHPAAEGSQISISRSEAENLRLSYIRDKILDYIEENYSRDISMQDAAQAMNYADTYFCRLFKECFQVNFSAFLNEFRVEKAKIMLKADQNLGIREISTSCGYGDSNYFTRVFKRITGMTPTEYRMSR